MYFLKLCLLTVFLFLQNMFPYSRCCISFPSPILNINVSMVLFSLDTEQKLSHTRINVFCGCELFSFLCWCSKFVTCVREHLKLQGIQNESAIHDLLTNQRISQKIGSQCLLRKRYFKNELR